MKQRILVAVVGIPLLLAVLCWAPDWATALLLAALSVIAAHELLTAVCGRGEGQALDGAARRDGCARHRRGLFFRRALCRLPGGDGAALAHRCGGAGRLCLASVLTYGRPGALVLQDVCVMAVAGLVIPWAFSWHAAAAHAPARGGDGAHAARGGVLQRLGCALHGPWPAAGTKMAPLVSPHKTVEGALGGIAGGVVGMVIFRIVFYFCTLVPLHIGWCVVIGLAGALMGELGDLSFSVIKRQVGIKDYGRLLPGHGGVLDRFDSVLFAAPMIWMIVCTVQL